MDMTRHQTWTLLHCDIGVGFHRRTSSSTAAMSPKYLLASSQQGTQTVRCTGESLHDADRQCHHFGAEWYFERATAYHPLHMSVCKHSMMPSFQQGSQQAVALVAAWAKMWAVVWAQVVARMM
jgi:hypothetical protein